MLWKKMPGCWMADFPVIDKAVKSIKGYAKSITSIKSKDYRLRPIIRGIELFYTERVY
jgi:hypothetical protein